MNNKTFIRNHKIVVLGKAVAHTFQKKHYSRSELDGFEQINLIPFIFWLFGQQLKLTANGWLMISGFPNIIVFPEALYDMHEHKVLSPINALKYLCGYDFSQSCYIIEEFCRMPIVEMTEECTKIYTTQMATKLLDVFNLNDILKEDLLKKTSKFCRKATQMAFGVLHQELGISRSLVAALIAEKKLAINKQYAFCFLQYMDDKVVSCIKYKHNQNGAFNYFVETTLRDSTFSMVYKPRHGQVHRDIYVFETVIEMLSFLTLVEEGVVAELPENSFLISLNSTYAYPLTAFLKEHPLVTTIHACLSNQSTGFAATQIIMEKEIYPNHKKIKVDDLQRYTATHGKYVKTWNEMLRYHLETKKKLEEEAANEQALLDQEKEIQNAANKQNEQA